MGKDKNLSIDSNQVIRDSIEKIAHHRLLDSRNVVKGTRKITGFVVKINTEGELAGTIDVQEYLSDVNTSAYNNSDIKPGYHKGVYLSALQDNSNGFLIVPKLYSDVVVFEDPATLRKYVTLFSHVDIVQLDSHDTITLGVREREAYDVNDEDGKTVEELEDTGVFSKTTYTKNSITSEVQDEDEENHSQFVINGEKIESTIGDDKSSMTLEQKQIHLKHDKAETILNDEYHLSQFDGSKVKIESGTVYIGNDTNTDDAVLGTELAGILSELVGYIGQIMTTTMMGPQPPLNVASFISLKTKIDSFKASHNGFLTNKVQIQK